MDRPWEACDSHLCNYLRELSCTRLSLNMLLCEGSSTTATIATFSVTYIKRGSFCRIAGVKPQPEYILPQIRGDYEQACKIRDLSPKASATLGGGFVPPINELSTEPA
jgi:hypothetical protein